MKRYFLFVLLAACAACSREDGAVPAADVPVEFVVVAPVVDTKAQDAVSFGCDSSFRVDCLPLEGVDTKVSEVTTANLQDFYVTTVVTGAIVRYNVPYSKSGSVFSGDQFWPADDPAYSFYACNCQMGTTSSTYNKVECPEDVDVVYATNLSASFQTVNALSFRHVYARIGTVSVQPPSGFTGTLVSASIVCPKSGTYTITNGFTSLSDAETVSLASSNDIWVVPGTYSMSATFSITDGTTVKTGIVRSGSVTLQAGKINNITAAVGDDYDYELVVTPASASVDVGGSQTYTATCTTKYNGSVIATDDVTSSASWTSGSTAVATVSSGVACGVAPGTAVLTASYKSASATATLVVNDYIVSYDNPVVSFSYDPSSFNAAGGTASPVVTYSQTVHYASGKTGTVTSGGSLSYSCPSAVTGFTLDASTGVVTVASNYSSASRSCSFEVVVTLNGKSGSGTATVTQGGAVIIEFDD